MTQVYQTNANEYNAKKTAQEFARVYFDKPREIENFKIIDDELATFNLVDGVAKYRVEFHHGKHLVSFPVWQVSRI